MGGVDLVLQEQVSDLRQCVRAVSLEWRRVVSVTHIFARSLHLSFHFSQCDKRTRETMDRYLDLIEGRACGRLLTTAAWLRKYVSLHPLYKHDSVISQELCYDIVEICDRIGSGDIEAPQLLGETSKATPKHGAVDDDAMLRGASFRLDLNDEKFYSYLEKHIAAVNLNAQKQ